MKIGQILFVYILVCNSICSNSALRTHTYVGQYGDIVNVHSNILAKSGVFEEVTIYPKVTIDSSERIARKGFLIRYPHAIGTVVICHGFMCDKYDVGMLRKIFKPGMYNVMTFDFRAHGENIEGQYCTFGKDEVLDVNCAVKFIKNHPDVGKLPVFAYGFSMGAGTVIEAQAQNNDLFKALVLDCPPDSSENMIKRGLENVKFNFFGYEFVLPGYTALQQYAFHPYVQGLVKKVLKAVSKLDSQNVATDIYPVSPVKSAKNITVPCLFIHCKNDEKIPVEAVKAIYDQVQGPKQLWLTKGRHHFDSYFYNPEKYIKHVRTFLSQVIDQPDVLPYGLIIDDDLEN